MASPDGWPRRVGPERIASIRASRVRGDGAAAPPSPLPAVSGGRSQGDAGRRDGKARHVDPDPVDGAGIVAAGARGAWSRRRGPGGPRLRSRRWSASDAGRGPAAGGFPRSRTGAPRPHARAATHTAPSASTARPSGMPLSTDREISPLPDVSSSPHLVGPDPVAAGVGVIEGLPAGGEPEPVGEPDAGGRGPGGTRRDRRDEGSRSSSPPPARRGSLRASRRRSGPLRPS